MNIIIKCKCPDCGEVQIEPEKIDLEVCSSHHEASYYSFICPRCDECVDRPADDRIIQILIGAGVKARVFDVIAGLLEEHHGEPFTSDDLIDFHELLERGDWLNQILALL